jgi:hypothetical protein
MVAVDEKGEIAGQEVFTPACVRFRGREARALRLSAAVLRADLRSRRLRRPDHPAVRMLEVGSELAEAEGYQLVFAMPDRAWLPFFRWHPRFDHSVYGCAGIRPREWAGARPDRLSAREVSAFGREYEQLWESAVRAFSIESGAVRSTARLAYKNGGHLTLEVRDLRDESLIGYAAIKRRSGLLVDLLAATPGDLTPVLSAVVDWLSRAPATSWDERGVLKAMTAPALIQALGDLGFEPIDYQFLFVCALLGEADARTSKAASGWYLTPGD